MSRENEEVVHFGNYILTTGYFNFAALSKRLSVSPDPSMRVTRGGGDDGGLRDTLTFPSCLPGLLCPQSNFTRIKKKFAFQKSSPSFLSCSVLRLFKEGNCQLIRVIQLGIYRESREMMGGSRSRL